MSKTPAPAGVRLVLPTGDTVALRLERGPDEAGVALWYAHLPPGGDVPPGARLAIDMLPAKTSVRVVLPQKEGQ